MTSADLAAINQRRLARGQKPLTFTESPGRLPLRIETAASMLAEKRERDVKAKTQKLQAANGNGSHLEQRFLRLWTDAGGPTLEREVTFAKPRRWRFDFAHVASRTAFELQGGHWGTGKPCPTCGQRKQCGHNRGGQMESDCEKAFTAWQLGWRVLPLTANMVNAETIAAIIQRIPSKEYHAR